MLRCVAHRGYQHVHVMERVVFPEAEVVVDIMVEERVLSTEVAVEEAAIPGQ